MHGKTRLKSSKKLIITAFVVLMFCFSIMNIKTDLVKADFTTSPEYGLTDLNALGIIYNNAYGTGITFSGNDYLNRTSFTPLLGVESFSIDIWILFDDNSTSQYLVSQYGTTNSKQLILWLSSGTLSLRIGNNTDYQDLSHSADILEDELYHITATYESGSPTTLCVNGSYEVDGGFLEGETFNENGFWVGNREALDRDLLGSIYTLTLYDYALNEAQSILIWESGTDFTLGNHTYLYTFDDSKNGYPSMTATYVICENSSEYMPFIPTDWEDDWSYRQYRTTIEHGIPTANNQFSYLSVDYDDEIYQGWYYYLENLTYFATVFETSTPIVSGQGQFFKLRFYAYFEDGSKTEAFNIHVFKGIATIEFKVTSFTTGDYWQHELSSGDEMSVEFRKNYDGQYILDVGYGDMGNSNFTALCYAESEFSSDIKNEVVGFLVVNQAYINPIASGVIWSKLIQWKAQSNFIVESSSMTDALNIPNVVVYYDPFVGNLLLDILTFLNLLWIGFSTIIFGAGVWLVTGLPVFITNAFNIAVGLLMTALFYAITTFISLFDSLMILIGFNMTWAQVWEFVLYLPMFFGSLLVLGSEFVGYAISLLDFLFVGLDFFNTNIAPHISTIQYYLYRYGLIGFFMVVLLVCNMCFMSNSTKPLERFIGALIFIGTLVIGFLRILTNGVLFIFQTIIILVRG